MKELRKLNKYSVSLPIFIGFFLRIINLQSPIVGVHSWRQADTAAMARHFALNSTPIWLPQVDWSGATKGYVESEFPLFPFIVAQLYKVFGINEFLGRGLSVLFSVLTIFLVIRIGNYLLDPESGWWGGLFFAILPLNIYYGRSFQAESFLLFLSALSVERFIAWKVNDNNKYNLYVSWISFLLACLIKLLPLIWIGCPLLLIHLFWDNKKNIKNIKFNIKKIKLNNLFKPTALIFFLSNLILILIWFRYSYLLGQESGISFFQWGSGSDRLSLNMIFNIRVWLDLSLRVILRNFSVIGVPLLIIGIFNSRNQFGGLILKFGLIAIFFTTVIFIRSSYVHEYYQLPIQLFACPLLGRGMKSMQSYILVNNLSTKIPYILLAFILTISLVQVSVDYYKVETRQNKIWMPLAMQIRNEVPIDSKIISVTGGDPTLMNLARRQGWLVDILDINQEKINYWWSNGATHLVGSMKWNEMYNPIMDSTRINLYQKLLCERSKINICPNPPDYTYIVPLKKLIN